MKERCKKKRKKEKAQTEKNKGDRTCHERVRAK